MGEAKPQRIQLRRVKGWRLQEASRALNGLPAVNCARPGRWGNPFRIGGYFMLGDHDNRRGWLSFAWTEALDAKYADERYTLIQTNEQAVDFFRRLSAAHPPSRLAELRGHNLACWCKPGSACHATVLLELANPPAEGA